MKSGEQRSMHPEDFYTTTHRASRAEVRRWEGADPNYDDAGLALDGLAWCEALAGTDAASPAVYPALGSVAVPGVTEPDTTAFQ